MGDSIRTKDSNNGIDISLEDLNFTNFRRTLFDVSEISIMRTLMNQLIETLYLKGKVIDIGGGKKANYLDFLNHDSYSSINIDENIDPDILVKVNEKFPLEECSFDTCLLFNVLEHIFDWNFIFQEITRILKNNGEIHIIIPFLYPVHGAPNDYIRATSDYFQSHLRKWNFQEIYIQPISYGPFSNSQLIGYTHMAINSYFARIAVILDKIFSKLFPNKLRKYSERCPLFYYVNAKLKK